VVSRPAAIRVGVLGVGRIGRMHAGLVARDVPGLALAAVYDANPATAASASEELDVPSAESADELIARPDVDAIAICSSTDTHVDLLVAAAPTGKPLFLEKPISLDLSEVDRGLDAVARAGSFGALQLVRITSRDPEPPPLAYIEVSGGIFLDMTVHDFDMARFVTSSEVEEVYARGEVRIDPAIGRAGDLDTAVATLRHADGTLTLIDNSRHSAYGYDQRVEAFGANGLAASDNPLLHTGFTRTARGTTGTVLPHFFLERYRTSYIAGWAAFEQAVRRGDPPPVTGADGRQALVLGLSAWRSVREGRPVRTSELA
jgi:myo-inositol 2-dehydrogenase/D-chiro-inositol 1-dehydrogenase